MYAVSSLTGPVRKLQQRYRWAVRPGRIRLSYGPRNFSFLHPDKVGRHAWDLGRSTPTTTVSSIYPRDFHQNDRETWSRRMARWQQHARTIKCSIWPSFLKACTAGSAITCMHRVVQGARKKLKRFSFSTRLAKARALCAWHLHLRSGPKTGP